VPARGRGWTSSSPSPRTARWTAPDLPGAGRTRPIDPRAGRAQDGARFLADLCQALDLEQVVLHGHSMGALVSARFAAGSPSGWRASS
jgi:pimeloyl-ACP methyl ester carboxylesterase